MMAIPMGTNKEKPSRELVQHLFNKNVELENKRRKAAQTRVPLDPNTWQQMRENYEAIILEDHAFAEQHDIEYSLWQLHYRRIEEFRALLNAALASAGSAAPQNGKYPIRSGPDRLTKIRSQFKTFLSEATGFYHDLMLKIRSKYGLLLGYFSDDPDNQVPMSKDSDKLSEVKKGLVSCNRCLIYLGDLSRYKGLHGEGDSKARDFTAASSYYMQASSLSPSSGNPHHQLAILAGYSNDELVSIYRYFRSLAVDNPFITARENLIIAFEKNRQNYIQLADDGKGTPVKTVPSKISGKGRGKGRIRPSPKDIRVETAAVNEKASSNSKLLRAFITRFVRLNGILFTRTSLETFAEVLSVVKNDLLELLPAGSDEELNFGSDAAECRLAIVRMIAILIFSVHNVNKENENQSYADILQRSVLLQNALTASFELMSCILERCNLLNDPASSYLLPGIMVFVEWLASCPDVVVGSELEEKQVNARSSFWNRCISLLNKLLPNTYIYANEHEVEACFSNMSKCDESETANHLALSEDFELRGYLPLVPAQLILNFSRKHSFGGDGSNKEKIARVQRINAAGKALVNVMRIGQEGVYFDTKLKNFVIGMEPQNSDDQLLSGPFVPNLNSSSVGIVGDEVALGHVTKPEVDVEAEDEDEGEVIVFRPSTNEKHMDDFSLNLTSSGLLSMVNGPAEIHGGKENGFFSVGSESFPFQNELNARLPAAVVNVTSQFMLPVQPSTSKWPVEQASIVNGFAHLNLRENGSSLKSELQDQFDSQPAAISVPYPQFVSADAGQNYSSQIPQASVPSNLDSVMSFGPAADGLPVMSSPGLKKNPGNRPARHLGPPPGFGSVPSKVMDESLKMALKNENPLVPQMDGYSWLDGYPMSTLNQIVGLSNSIQVGPTFHSSNKSNGSIGIPSFPFPGKQVSSLQVQSENHKGWQDDQFSKHMNPYEEQQRQLLEGNQQPVRPQQLYQGQSLWEGHFFV